MNKEFIIRPMVDSDRAGIETYFRRLHGENAVFFNPGNFNHKRFMDFFDGKVKNLTVFLAFEPGCDLIAGMVFLSDSHTKVPMLGIGIDEDYAGCGLGVQLMEFIHNYAQKKGMGGIMLNVHYANTRAQALYTKMGYYLLGHSVQGQMLQIKRFPVEE